MKGWILSYLVNSPSIALLLKVCRARGHWVDLVYPKNCLVERRGARPPQAGAA